VRKGQLESVERNRDKSLGVTVYVGHRRGNASTSDFSPAAVEQTVRAAFDIARFTAEDPMAGLPDADDIASDHRDLDLFHPWSLSSEQAAHLALACEDAALQTSRKITNSEGAGVSAQQSHFFSAHTHGFRGGYASSRHSLSVAPIAGKGAGMQRDAWYSSMRSPDELASPAAVGRYAAERALSRLKSRRIPTTECPVLFESPLAAGLLGGFVQAVSGGALYRKSTFLVDSLGKTVFPRHIDIVEDPFVLRGKGSSPFDDEGVRVQARSVVKGGRVEGYFLSSYSARKLGMKTTGNSGGSHNLTMTSRHTQAGDDLDAMLKKAGHRPVRDRVDGAGRELRDGRLFPRRQRILGRERRNRLSGAGDHHRRQSENHVQGHRSGGGRRLQLRRQVGRIDPDQPDEGGGKLVEPTARTRWR
jgi:PmbA protein